MFRSRVPVALLNGHPIAGRSNPTSPCRRRSCLKLYHVVNPQDRDQAQAVAAVARATRLRRARRMSAMAALTA